MTRLILVLSLALAGVAFAEPNLPDTARKVGEDRYKASGDWESVMKHYKTALPADKYPRRSIINQPGIKAIHLANPGNKGGWEGLNIYQVNDEVRISVVRAPGTEKKKKG